MPISSIFSSISRSVRNAVRSALGTDEQGLSRADHTKFRQFNIPPPRFHADRVELNFKDTRYQKLRNLNEIRGLEQLSESQNRAEKPASVIHRKDLPPKKYYPSQAELDDIARRFSKLKYPPEITGLEQPSETQNRAEESTSVTEKNACEPNEVSRSPASASVKDGRQSQENTDQEFAHRDLGGAILSTVYSGARAVVLSLGRGVCSIKRTLINRRNATKETPPTVQERAEAIMQRLRDPENLRKTAKICIALIVICLISYAFPGSLAWEGNLIRFLPYAYPY